MKRAKTLEIGSVVAYSGSIEDPRNNIHLCGIVIALSGPSVDFGRRKSVLVHWTSKDCEPYKSWEAPRNLYHIEEITFDEGIEGEKR